MSMRWLSVFAMAALVPLATVTNGQQDDTGQVVERAARYVSEFVTRFSRIVAEEVYVQERSEGVSVTHSNHVRRELTSDFLFVRASDSADWLVFRDVRLVNGRDVRGRENHLLDLLTSPATQARSLAETLAAENARHSLPNWPAINNPLIALALLQDEYRDRFTFSLAGSDSDETTVLRFREHMRPTLLRAPKGEIVLQGQLWVDGRTGSILKTELAIGRNVAITTTFTHDEHLDMYVPVQMDERYSAMFATGRATYSNFRSFQVQTDEVLEKKGRP